MANLSKPSDILGKYNDADVISFPQSNVKVYRGAALVFVKGTGYATTLTAANNPPDRFIGVGLETSDNSAGSAGDRSVKIARKGLFKFNQSGLAVSDTGCKVYFSDDNTVTKTIGTNNIYAGRLEVLNAEGAYVRIDDATVTGIRTRQVTMQPAPLTAAGTSRVIGYHCPAGAIAFVRAGVQGYSVKPNFATSAVLILSKLVSGGTRTTLLNAANININNQAQAVDTPTALTLTATAADLRLAATDALEAAITAVGALTAAGDPYATLEVLEIGGTND